MAGDPTTYKQFIHPCLSSSPCLSRLIIPPQHSFLNGEEVIYRTSLISRSRSCHGNYIYTRYSSLVSQETTTVPLKLRVVMVNGSVMLFNRELA